MIVVNYGGGVNSTALLLEALRRDIQPDLVVFADTGSEMPHTYEYLKMFGEYLGNFGIAVEVVRRMYSNAPRNEEWAGTFVPLHVWCEHYATVPSRAFGLSGCTDKWKQRPADMFIRNHPMVQEALARGEKVERWIGYDADEPRRAARMAEKKADDPHYVWRAPLIEWDMGRKECLAVIAEEGLPSPGKSSCWMCPSMRKGEIDALGQQYPDLLNAALRMERVAIAEGSLASRAGLGGRLNWNAYRAGNKAQPQPEEQGCGCYDGDAS